jgi:predicted HAD superfamily Cof-like phosphohydrolase
MSKKLLKNMSRKTTIEQVEEFHKAFGVANAYKPNVEDDKVNQLRLELLVEELEELADALDDGDPVATLDALTDLQYVLDGAYLTLGFAHVKERAFAEVHRSNMSKLGSDGKPILSESGKVLKGEHYFKPNLKQFVDNK